MISGSFLLIFKLIQCFVELFHLVPLGIDLLVWSIFDTNHSEKFWLVWFFHNDINLLIIR